MLCLPRQLHGLQALNCGHQLPGAESGWQERGRGLKRRASHRCLLQEWRLQALLALFKQEFSRDQRASLLTEQSFLSRQTSQNKGLSNRITKDSS